MALVGYARVSSTGQSLEIQIEQLQEAGCTRIFSEKVSGTGSKERPELEACMNYVRDGDVLMVTRMDRFARSNIDFWKLLSRLEDKETKFKVLLQPEIDTSTSNGRLVTAIMAAMAQFETEMRADRQREGIDKAMAKGVYTRANTSLRRKLDVAHGYLKEGYAYRQASEKAKVSERTLRDKFPGFNIRAPMAGPIRSVLGDKPARTPHSVPIPPSAAEAVEAQPTPKDEAPKRRLFGRF